MQLSPAQHSLHLRALELCAKHRRVEAMLIVVLREIDKTKLFKKLGQPSLFGYAIRILGLSESVAYAFIAVARKCEESAPLRAAIETQSLTVAKASRIVSALTLENAEALIEFARTHSTRETEFEVARLQPKCAAPDRMRPLSEDLVKLEMSVSKAVLAKLTRAQALLASQSGKHTGFEGVLEQVLNEYLERHDPVKRAERAVCRKIAKPSTVARSTKPPAPQLCARTMLFGLAS